MTGLKEPARPSAPVPVTTKGAVRKVTGPRLVPGSAGLGLELGGFGKSGPGRVGPGLMGAAGFGGVFSAQAPPASKTSAAAAKSEPVAADQRRPFGGFWRLGSDIARFRRRSIPAHSKPAPWSGATERSLAGIGGAEQAFSSLAGS